MPRLKTGSVSYRHHLQRLASYSDPKLFVLILKKKIITTKVKFGLAELIQNKRSPGNSRANLDIKSEELLNKKVDYLILFQRT